MSKEYERIREQIARIIYSVYPYIQDFMTGKYEDWEISKPHLDKADQLLKLVRIEADDQDKPENPYTTENIDEPITKTDEVKGSGFDTAVRHMLTPKDGKVWVRCLSKEG